MNPNSTNCDKLPCDELVAQNLDLPIHFRKGTRVVTKPSYPLANYLSYT